MRVVRATEEALRRLATAQERRPVRHARALAALLREEVLGNGSRELADVVEDAGASVDDAARALERTGRR